MNPATIADMDRRMDDNRLLRVETDIKEMRSDVKALSSDVSKVHAKITNGITERGKRTEEGLKALTETTMGLEKTMSVYIAAEAEAKKARTIDEHRQSAIMAGFDKNQKLLVKAIIATLITLLGGAMALLAWIVVHAPEIGAIIDALTKAQ